MYLSLKLPPDRLEAAGTLCVALQSPVTAKPWFPATKAINAIQHDPQGPVDPAGLETRQTGGAIATQRTDSQGSWYRRRLPWIAGGKNANQRRAIATDIYSLSRTANPGPRSFPSRLTDHQRENLPKAFAARSASWRIAWHQQNLPPPPPPSSRLSNQSAWIILRFASPTDEPLCGVRGPRRVRSTRSGAKTIHSCPQSGPARRWLWRLVLLLPRRGRPLPFQVLVVDESSMIEHRSDVLAIRMRRRYSYSLCRRH